MKSKKKVDFTLADLKANPNNPRLDFTPEQAEAFKRALLEYGDLGGIVANKRFDFRLVGGHKRLGTLSQAFPGASLEGEWLKVPDKQGTVWQGFLCAMDGGRFSLRIVDWPEEKERAANVIANSWRAEWDDGKLAELLKDMGESVDVKLLGLDGNEVDRLLASLTSGQVGNVSFPTAMENENSMARAVAPIETEIQGEVVLNGRFILVYRNSEEKEFWMKRLGLSKDQVVLLPKDVHA